MPPAGQRGAWVLGVDSGGSGLRIALATVDGPAEDRPVRPVGTATGEPVAIGSSGVDPDHLVRQLLPAARALLEDAAGHGARGSTPRNARPGAQQRIEAVCLGAAGMATLGDGLRAALPRTLGEELGVRRIALAADAVTAFAGALGQRPGAVAAAGTGMIALGTDLRSWRRADGWGHLLGDCGGGAWIGRAGLEAALRTHDGREGGSAALLARAEAVFGPVAGLPGRLYPRTDRSAVLASFAPQVARCAEDGDPVARKIVRTAAREIARSTAAVCPAAAGTPVAFTGGLLGLGEPLQAPLAAELAERLPHARTVPAAGGPLDGALLIAARLAAGRLRLPDDPSLLHLG